MIYRDLTRLIMINREGVSGLGAGQAQPDPDNATPTTAGNQLIISESMRVRRGVTPTSVAGKFVTIRQCTPCCGSALRAKALKCVTRNA